MKALVLVIAIVATASAATGALIVKVSEKPLECPEQIVLHSYKSSESFQ